MPKTTSLQLKLNVECQISTLKSFDFMSLLNIAQTNEHCMELAVDIFQQNFVEKTVRIEAPSFPNRFKIKQTNEIIVTDIEMILKILSIFGPSIRVLRVRFERIQLNDAQKIAQHIAQFCSENLTHFGISGITRPLWRLMNKPFGNVHDVAFGKVLEPMARMKLNQTFPKLRTLMLLNTELKHPELFACTFAHLNHLFISTLSPDNSFTTETGHLLKNNPQIRHLSVQHNFRKFLESANRKLKNIETLELLWPQDDYSNGEPIHFDKVEKLIVTSNSFPVPTKVQFTRLQELECYCYPELNHEYIEYIKFNRNLKRLNITSDVKDAQFAKLRGAFKYLIEASIKCGEDIKADTVIRFIKCNDKINKLLLLTDDRLLFSHLVTRLEHSWTVDFVCNGSSCSIRLERHPNLEQNNFIYLAVISLVFMIIVVILSKKIWKNSIKNQKIVNNLNK